MNHLICIMLLLPALLEAQVISCPAVEDFDRITSAVTENFYDRTFKGLNWPERILVHRNTVRCSSTDEEVAIGVNSLLAELLTSHTHLYTQQDLEYWGLKSVFSGDLDAFKIPLSGIWPEKLNGRPYAKLVVNGSPAERAGVRAGDELRRLDGKEFAAIGFVPGKRSVITLSHDGKKFRKVRILPTVESVQEAFLKASKRSEKIYETAGKKIGYFHLWCGTHDEFLHAMNNALDRFKNQKISELILDLRDGFGGANPEYLKGLASDSFFQKIPKIFLINAGVRSGKEWLAAIIKRDHLGTLVGTTTAGAFIGGGPVDLGTDKYFLYLAMNEFNPPGLPPIEGIGVSPDAIAVGCAKFCSDGDLQLKAAIELARTL